MRVVQINVIYGQRSTGRIVETLHNEYLQQGIDSYVLFGRGSKTKDPRVIRCSFLWEAKLWRLISCFTGNFYGGVPLSTLRIKHLIRKIKPDVVHLQCVNGNMVNIFSLLSWLKKRGIKTVVTSHAEFLYTGGCGVALCDKWKKGCNHCPYKQRVFGRFGRDRSKSNWSRFKKAFSDFKGLICTFVSPWLASHASLSPILSPYESHVVFNPVDLSLYRPTIETECPREIAHRKYVFLPVARFNDANKGMDQISAIASSLSSLNLLLVIAGAPSALSNGNILCLGYVNSPQVMSSLYKNASVTLILSKIESFSMPVAESLCCGTPVVGFKAGGPESIAPSQFAHFADQGNLDELLRLISLAKDTRVDETVRDLFDPKLIASKYLSIY
jgi:putative colanic acid biosynthesis glycosyltransferase